MLNRLGAVELAKRLASREVTAQAVVHDCLARIHEREDQVGAWAHVDVEHAFRQARALDAGPVRGLLHGLPIGIKDIIATHDLPTQYGTPIYKDHRPAWDAACVAAIRACGGLIIGKTATTELAYLTPGNTTNPLNSRHTPGGSSSGSAASVSDYMVPLAVGTQTGGSTIRPASYCGVVGFKPSFGLMDRHGVKPVSETIDTLGVFARSVDDIALLAAGITGRDALFPVKNIGRPKIAIWRTPEADHASPESVEALERAATCISRSGGHVADLKPPDAHKGVHHVYQDIELFEMARALRFEKENCDEQLSPGLRARLEQGALVPADLYDRRIGEAEMLRLQFKECVTEFDAILTFSAPGEAPADLSNLGDGIFNRGWTLLHAPCLTLPVLRGPQGLPVGIQLVGAFRDEVQILACGRWLEEKLRQ